MVRRLAGDLARALLEEVREETAHRFRFVFVLDGRPRSLLISIDPRRPWLGRPLGRWDGPRRHPGPLARAARGARGAALVGLAKDPVDRVVRLDLADGRAFVAELVPHRANLILLDADGRVAVAARAPKGAGARLAAGSRYSLPEPPPVAADPFARDLAGWKAALGTAGGRPAAVAALAGSALGFGRGAAELLSRSPARSPDALAAAILAALHELSGGARAPAIELPEDGCRVPGEAARPERGGTTRIGELLRAAAAGEAASLGWRLLPWAPSAAEARGAVVQLDDPAATAGLFHEARDRLEAFRRRERDLLAVLSDEARRLDAAARRARRDGESFRDPECHRRAAEALLAGLGAARVADGRVEVPDPWDPAGAPVVVDLKPGEVPAAAAERLFATHRRADRGRTEARRRAAERAAAVERLQQADRRYRDAPGPEALATLEGVLRSAGVPVGLPGAVGRGATAGPGKRRSTAHRPPGIRILTSRDGIEILVGRTARDNHTLTFKVAGPEDLWFHALGATGAHVVVRTGGKGPRAVPEATRREAAEAAAWYSEVRSAEWVDVQWTRRKYVRRPRGAAPGSVTLKKFETLRVRPREPTAAAVD